ncbi:uncharacterized protein LOC106359240 [Brassica napus]|uniref:uncharacterized protein LOC106359240 n=1 Tax=Brassica napus TaxID=3708 RepID=UPI0020795B65|nr:uncharacterized protein LOC106359240 [Brassica napus]
MRMLSWNCQGLGNTPTVRHLQELLGQHHPELLFLSETKNRRRYIEGLVEKFGFSNLKTVEPVGKGGGLAVLWKKSCKVEVLQANRRVIDLKIQWQEKMFFLTCVYGEPIKGKRGDVWERITRTGTTRNGAWVMTGDFNELIDPSEKIDGAARSAEEGKDFRQMLHACGLWNIKHVSYQFSWAGTRNNENVQSSGFQVRPALDKRESFITAVSQSWKRHSAGQAGLLRKISQCRKDISIWKRAAKPNSALRIHELHSKIDEATRSCFNKGEELSLLRSELNEEYHNKEIFWMQKSRLNWLRSGDRNTKFFHAVTKNRRAQNRILSLIDDDDKEWFAEEDLGRLADSHFKLLYSSEDVGITLEDWNSIPAIVTEEQNAQLMAQISREEVREAVFDINPHKCPGPDGMNGFFFHQFWDTMGDDLTSMAQEFLRTGKLEEGINKTNICLVPKKLEAKRLVEFRPITVPESTLQGDPLSPYQVLINGTPHGDIRPTRGIRQGDPLSPYLFVICTEMLVQKLIQTENSGEITCLKVARGAPAVSHLLYADDSMFYCKQSDEELSRLTVILQEYSLASGQRINYQKSSIYFGKNIPSRREEIKLKLGMKQEGGDGIYLGLPESFGGSRVSILSFLKERLKQIIGGWQNRFLSPAGKEVLLKAIGLALPTYTMSCFLVPKTICKKFMAIMSDYWWKSNTASKGMHWRSWESLCSPKDKGGLGFKDLEAFNTALLGKQLWRIITQPDSLLARIFKSRYFRSSDPLNAPLESRPSYAWRSIHSAQHLIKQGAKVIIGNGENTNIWRERWLESSPASPITQTSTVPEPIRHLLSMDMKVADLMMPCRREWNSNLINSIFPEGTRRKILSIHPQGPIGEDTYSWEYSKSGHYSVKSGYWVQTNIIAAANQRGTVDQPSLDDLYQRVWKYNTSPKVCHFLWRCISNSLPAAANMRSRHISKDGSCSRCGMESETVNHILFQCSNDFLFQGKDYPAPDTVNEAIEDTAEWMRGQEEDKTKVKKPTSSTQHLKWTPPTQNWIKCNTDGAWHKDHQQQGIGWVSRDYAGRLLWAGAQRFEGLSSPVETEATALNWAIRSMARLGYSQVIFETDSQVLARMIEGSAETWPKIQPIIQDITQSLQKNRSYRVEFFSRDGNKTADRIANEAFSLLNYVPKLYSMVSSWLKPVLEADMPSVGLNYDVGLNNIG